MGERSWKDGVVEICVREKGGRKGITRVLEGWKYAGVVKDCAWDELDSLKSVVTQLKSGLKTATETSQVGHCVLSAGAVD